MRIILLLIFISCFSAPILSQAPSSRKIEAQKAQAIKEAKQQMVDLKKQIAEAKAGNEDPDAIKQMETQLTTLEQMVNMMEKTDLSGKMRTEETPVTKTIESKFISPLIPITLKQPVKAPNEKEATDYLLWYKGKKIDNNTIITIDGTIVRYNSAKNIVIVDPDEKKDSTPYIGLVQLLAQMGKIKNRFVSMMDDITNSFLMAPEIVKAYNEYGYIEQRYYEIARNHFTVSFPGNEPLQLYWKDLLAAIDKLKPIDIPEPPERKDLCKCDTKWREELEDKMLRWQEEFWGEEDWLLEKYKIIYMYFESHPGTRSLLSTTPNLNADLNKALALVIERKATKLKRLADVYDNGNIYVEDVLVYGAITFNKELIEKIGHPEQEECMKLKRMSYGLIDQIKDMVVKKKIFEKYIKEQKTLKNYNVVLDYLLYISHETNNELLNAVGGSFFNVPENYGQIWKEQLKNYNRFKLKMEMDFELHDGEEDDLYMVASGKLESAEMIVSMGRVFPCKWHLYITQSDYRNKNTDEEKFYIPFTVKEGVKTYPKPGRGPFNYNGPATLKMVFPIFRFSFCNNTESDSAVLDILRYSERDLQAYPNPDYANSYSTDMLAYANKMLIGMLKTKMNAPDLTSLAGRMMNVDKVASPLAPTGNALLDRMVTGFFINQHRLDLQTRLPDVSHTGNTVVLFDAVNGSPTVISQPQKTTDPTDADRRIKIRLVRGEITVKVIHAPL